MKGEAPRRNIFRDWLGDWAMKHSDLASCLCRWIEQTYHHPEWREQNHCFTIHRDVRLPGASVVEAISVAHRGPGPEDGPDEFHVGVWQLEPAGVDVPALDRMNRHLQLFGAWYSEFLEAAHCRGFASRHRLRVSGNLVGASVEAGPILDILSHWGGNISFWIYREAEDRIDVEPYTGVARSLRPARRRLTELLRHLTWRDLETPLPGNAPR